MRLGVEHRQSYILNISVYIDINMYISLYMLKCTRNIITTIPGPQLHTLDRLHGHIISMHHDSTVCINVHIPMYTHTYYIGNIKLYMYIHIYVYINIFVIVLLSYSTI